MKTIKPNPLMLIITGVAAVLAVIGITVSICVETSDFRMVAVSVFAIGAFVFCLVNYLTYKKVQFNNEVFVVDGRTYRFSDISNADAEAVPVTRHSSTLKIEIYVNGTLVLTFKKNDRGADDFIAYMRNHGVMMSIGE